jgi:uncharacterized protein involved in type VI secretion and phage assembly
MASGGERRMLFDIRGRRKHVVRFVYAILALLMGGSLFLVVGPVNLASLIGNSNTATSETTKLFQERAERLERELRKDPTDEDKQLSLVRTRLQGGQAAAAGAERNGEAPGAESREEFEAATAAWDVYEKQAGRKNASPTVAQLVAGAWFSLASNPTAAFEEAFESVEEAARVQKIYAGAKQTASAYTTLAAYQLITGNFKEGNVSGKKAEGLATSKAQRKEVEKNLKELRKQGKQNLKAKKEIAKAEKGKGKEKLENPFGGLGGESAATSVP